MAEECENWLRGTTDVKQPGEDTKAELALVRSQYRTTMMMIELPKVIALAKKAIEAKESQQERVKEAGIAAGIHEVPEAGGK